MDAVTFNRICAALALAFLIVTIVGRMMRGTSHQDFPQYYMGGVMARLGAWDQLYPIPKPGATRNPGFIEDSTMKPRYAEEMRKHGAPGDGVRYMQPPPFVLLLVPLSFLTYPQAYVVWTLVMMLCAWGIAVQAGWIYTICRGRPTRFAGILTLLIATSLQAHRWVRVQNMSPLMGLLIGAAVLAMLSHRPARGALAMWLGGLAKYATGVLVPLYVVMRQWRALLWLVAFSAASVVIAVAVMGWGPFDEYLTKIAPTLKNTNTLVANQALQGYVARTLHGAERTQAIERADELFGAEGPIPRSVLGLITAVQVLVLLMILGLISSRWRFGAVTWEAHPSLVFAAAAALLCWLLIFSPMYWEHYTAYLAPLWGWVAWEGTRSRGRLVLVLVISALMYVPLPVVFKRLSDPWAANMLWGTCLLLLLAVARLARSPIDARSAGAGAGE